MEFKESKPFNQQQRSISKNLVNYYKADVWNPTNENCYERYVVRYCKVLEKIPILNDEEK